MTSVVNPNMTRVPLRLSDEMKVQIERFARQEPGNGGDHLTLLTFESAIDQNIPDPVVMWEKATCC